MIARDELKRVFRRLKKYENILISAYLENDGDVDEVITEYKVIESLINSRLLWRPADNEAVRLSRELLALFERVLRDPRRLTVDADTGSFVIEIENNVNRYKEAVRCAHQDDASHYLSQVERLVDDLRSSLLDSSGQLWQKINSEFGYVASLELKIKENEAVLSHAKRLNDGLEVIKVREIEEMVGADTLLRRPLQRWLLDAVELCRKETVDAIHKLNELLFEYRQQQKTGRLIDAFYRRYQTDPGYIPLNYTELGDIPNVFNQVSPAILLGHVSLDDPKNELALIEIISGLRKERVVIEKAESIESVEVQPDEPPIEISLSQLRQAVEDFYLKVVDSDSSLSAIENIPPEEVEADVEIWMYAVIARYNNMDESERLLFNVSYLESIDTVFNGRHLVHDIHVGLN